METYVAGIERSLLQSGSTIRAECKLAPQIYWEFPIARSASN